MINCLALFLRHYISISIVNDDKVSHPVGAPDNLITLIISKLSILLHPLPGLHYRIFVRKSSELYDLRLEASFQRGRVSLKIQQIFSYISL